MMTSRDRMKSKFLSDVATSKGLMPSLLRTVNISSVMKDASTGSTPSELCNAAICRHVSPREFLWNTLQLNWTRILTSSAWLYLTAVNRAVVPV